MTDETVAVATQVAPVAQEPSVSVEEVKQTDTPPQEAAPEEPEAIKARLAKQQEHFEKRDARQRKALTEQQRQLQAAQDRIREIEEKLKATEPRDNKPNQDDFDDTEAYADALAEYKLAQREKAKTEESKKPDLDKVVDQNVQLKLKEADWKQKEAEFIKVTPDYEQNAQTVNQFLALANKNDPRFQAFSTAILNAENAPALINYLGANPKEIMNLFNAQTPLDVEFALEGMLEKLGAAQPVDGQQEAQPKAILPPPPKSVQGNAKVAKSEKDMTGRELLNIYHAKGK
jgi:hypothetical protein